MFRIECEKALSSKCRTRYKGIAYDGCWFYLTTYCESKIFRFDSCFNLKQAFDTCRCYTYLCYDPNERCFWAAADKCFSAIYKLNECFEETESIALHCPGCDRAVTGLSYDCCSKCLVVSFASGVARVEPKCPQSCTFFIKSPCKWIVGVLSLCPYTLCHSIDRRGGEIRVYSDCGCLICETKISCEFQLESAVFVPCAERPSECRFCVLASKHGGYPYVLTCVMEGGSLCDDICGCNYEVMRRCCPPAGPCSPCGNKDSCNDVLESIALVETSIAHILNAEGEKLQKAIACTDDVCQLLEVNDSVRRTIEKATHLECILYDKMDALRDCGDFCCESNSCGCTICECER